jgi:hypothetical protein
MKTNTNTSRQYWRTALELAVDMMNCMPDLEPTSALKQAGSECGIEFGDDMGAFVTWARKQPVLS